VKEAHFSFFFFMQVSPDEETDTKKQKVEKSNESYQNVKEVRFFFLSLLINNKLY